MTTFTCNPEITALVAALKSAAPGDTVVIQSGGVPVEIDLGDAGLIFDQVAAQSGGSRNFAYGIHLTVDQSGPVVPNFLGAGQSHPSVRTPFVTLRGRIVVGSPTGGGSTNPTGIATKFTRFWHRPRLGWWPDWVGAGQTWHDVLPGLQLDGVTIKYPDLFALLYVQNHAGDITLADGYRSGWGYGLAQEPFVEGVKYPDFDSPAEYWLNVNQGKTTPNYLCRRGPASGDWTASPGGDHVGADKVWGDTAPRNAFPGQVAGETGLLYNTLGMGPRLACLTLSDNNVLTIDGCYFHDALGRGAAILDGKPGEKIRIRNNVFDRNHGDQIQIGYTGSNANNEEIIEGNLFLRLIQGPSADLGPNRAHSDCVQSHFTRAAGSRAVKRVYNNNVLLSTPKARKGHQFLFVNTQGSTFSVGTQCRNNLAVGLHAQGIWNAEGRDEYIRNNMVYNPSWMQTQAGTAISPVVGPSISIGSTGPALPLKSRNGSGAVLNNIATAVRVAPNIRLVSNNLAVADKSMVTESTILQGGAVPTTFAETYEFVRRREGYRHLGPKNYPTLLAHLQGYACARGDDRIVAHPFNRFNAITGSAVRSDLLLVTGGAEGSQLPLSLPASLKARVIPVAEALLNGFDPNATYAAAFGATSATVGSFLQLEATAASTPLSTGNFSFSIGGEGVSWSITTKSANVLPGVRKNTKAGAIIRTIRGPLQRNGENLVDAGEQAILYFDFEVMASGGSAGSGADAVASGSSGRTLRSTAQINSANNAIANLFLSPSNGGGTSVGQALFTNLSHGDRFRVGVSVDTNEPDPDRRVLAGGYNVKTGQPLTPTLAAVATQALNTLSWNHDHGSTADNPRFFSGLDVILYAMFVDNRSFQRLGITPKEHFNYEPDELGPNGEGLLGVPNPAGIALKPLFFTPGLVSLPNFGEGGALTGLNTGFAQAVAGSWPPQLTLIAEVQGSTALMVGRPVDILVYPVGINKAVTVTATKTGPAGSLAQASKAMPVGSNGVVFTYTPTAAGQHVLSFANDGGYVNPAAITLTATA